MKSLAAVLVFLLVSSVPCAAVHHWSKKGERGHGLDSDGFLDFMHSYKADAEVFIQNDLRFAEFIDRPWTQFNWTAFDVMTSELQEKGEFFKSVEDVLVGMLTALWEGPNRLTVCGNLSRYVQLVEDKADNEEFDMDMALAHYSSDLRCIADLMKKVFWYNKTAEGELSTTKDVLEAVIHTLGDLTVLYWADVNLQWAAFMAFDVIAAENHFYDSEGGRRFGSKDHGELEDETDETDVTSELLDKLLTQLLKKSLSGGRNRRHSTK